MGTYMSVCEMWVPYPPAFFIRQHLCYMYVAGGTLPALDIPYPVFDLVDKLLTPQRTSEKVYCATCEAYILHIIPSLPLLVSYNTCRHLHIPIIYIINFIYFQNKYTVSVYKTNGGEDICLQTNNHLCYTLFRTRCNSYSTSQTN